MRPNRWIDRDEFEYNMFFDFQDLKNLDDHVIKSMIKRFFSNAWFDAEEAWTASKQN